MPGRGLHSVYAGCRCDDCIAAAAKPVKRLNRGALTASGERNGYLKAECWCQRTTVDVPIAEVRKGLTRSCRSYWCRPPDN